KEIKALIADSTQKVQAGSSRVDAAGHTMTGVVLSVKKVTDLIAEIAAASQEQSMKIAQVSTAVKQMDTVVQQNASLVEAADAAQAREAAAGGQQAHGGGGQRAAVIAEPEARQAQALERAAAHADAGMPVAGEDVRPGDRLRVVAQRERPERQRLVDHADLEL